MKPATVPHNIEAEAALVGSLILDSSQAGDVAALLKPDDFHHRPHRLVWEAIHGLRLAGKPIGMVELNNWLRERNQLTEAGGLDYVIQLAEQVPSTVLNEHYAREVKTASQKRSLYRLAEELKVKAGGPDEVEEILAVAYQRMMSMGQTGASQVARVDGVLGEAVEAVRNRASSGDGISGVSFGLESLDEATDGLQPGEMTVIAARPSMGKTIMGVNIAERAALAGTPAIVFSIEMARQQLAMRILAGHTGISGQDLRHPRRLSDGEWQQLDDCVSQWSEAPLYICDEPGLSAERMATVARQHAVKHGIGLVVVDYLQLMSAPASLSREQQVSHLSKSCKLLARELNIPLVALAQLSRSCESRENKRPILSDLRDSGSIEQDADVVMMLYREEYYHKGDHAWLESPKGQMWRNVAEVIIAKQRNGPTGHYPCAFDGERTRFLELDANHPIKRNGAAA